MPLSAPARKAPMRRAILFPVKAKPHVDGSLRIARSRPKRAKTPKTREVEAFVRMLEEHRVPKQKIAGFVRSFLGK